MAHTSNNQPEGGGDNNRPEKHERADKIGQQLAKDSSEASTSAYRAALRANPDRTNTVNPDAKPGEGFSLTDKGKIIASKETSEHQGKADRTPTRAMLDEAPGQRQSLDTAVQKTEQRSQKTENAETEKAARELFSRGSLYADGLPRRPGEVLAQSIPEKHAVHEGVMTALGVGHGVINFAASTLGGIGDTIRMMNAANREAHPLAAMLPDTDPEGTRKLHETCQTLAMGSRVLLQYSTTLNESSPFYGKDFDPEARQAAMKLAQVLPEKLKDEIKQYKNGDPEARAAKSTELVLDIYTCAESGGMAVAKAGQVARESKVLSQISSDLQTFASKLKELPQAESMTRYLDANLPKLGPKLAVAHGPGFESGTGPGANDEHLLQMGRHSDGEKPHRGGDAREARENRKTNEALELKKIMAEGWTTEDEARAVKYLRDKGETMTNNQLEGKEGWGRQTDGLEWELKNMSNVKERSDIVRGVVGHAKNGSGKYTGDEHLGRVLIDARRQPNMTQALAEKGMEEAFKNCPKLKEIRIVGKDFDIGLKRGHQIVKR